MVGLRCQMTPMSIRAQQVTAWGSQLQCKLQVVEAPPSSAMPMHAAGLKPVCHMQMVGSPWHQILPILHALGPGASPAMCICERHNKGVSLSHSNEDGGLAGSDPEIHHAGFRN